MPSFEDKEFGKVVVRRSSRARSMKATVSPNGELRISLPNYATIHGKTNGNQFTRKDI